MVCVSGRTFSGQNCFYRSQLVCEKRLFQTWFCVYVKGDKCDPRMLTLFLSCADLQRDIFFSFLMVDLNVLREDSQWLGNVLIFRICAFQSPFCCVPSSSCWRFSHDPDSPKLWPSRYMCMYMTVNLNHLGYTQVISIELLYVTSKTNWLHQICFSWILLKGVKTSAYMYFIFIIYLDDIVEICLTLTWSLFLLISDKSHI